MKKFAFLILFLSLLSLQAIQAQSYSEVWFENSNLSVRYSHSNVSYQGDSWMKNLKRQLPVSDSVFFTPNNALELHYTSGANGNWTADVYYPRRKSLALNEESVLTFKIYVQSKTSASELPAIEVIQPDSSASSILPMRRFIKNFEENKWLSVEVPLKNFELAGLENGITSIRFLQNTRDGKEHKVFVDQIEILPIKVPQSPLTSPAILSSAVGFEKHVNLTWKLPLTPSIRYIKIYRSEDNEIFYPVAIRPIFVKRYSDIVPESKKTYYYKIAWVDFKYQESPVSNVLEVKTATLKDKELIAMVQQANVDYLIDGEEFNSGMQLKNITNQNSLVSVKNTGVGLLALIANVRNDFALKEQLMKRLEKIISFLEKAESAHGVFPELMDGRTGQAVYPVNTEGSLVVNLESTGLLMQALLVAKEYFNQSSEVERQLRKRIERIWRAVEWNSFTKSNNPYLYSQWSSADSLDGGVPLSGLSKMYLYVLALASPEFNIGLESYSKVLQRPLKIKERYVSMEDSLLITENPEDAASILNYNGNDYYSESYVNGHIYYGLRLAVGSADDSVRDLLIGFMALDPRNKQDDFANYGEYMKNLIQIQHRKALEEDVDISLTRLFPSRAAAIFPFNGELALKNIKHYYLDHTESVWTEYGFVREIDFKQNRILYPKDDLENALTVVMIENGKSGLIWQLFSQNPGINKVLKAVFKN